MSTPKPKSEVVQADPNTVKADYRLPTLALCAVNPVITFFILKNGREIVSHVLPYLKQGLNVDDFNGKLEVALTFGIYLAALFQLLVIFTIGMRVFGKRPNPLYKTDPPALQALQRVLINTLEQSAIFIPNWLYFLFHTKDTILVITFAVLFIVSRASFSTGYVVGSLVRVTVLRQLGFMVGMSLNVILVLTNLGIYNAIELIV